MRLFDTTQPRDSRGRWGHTGRQPTAPATPPNVNVCGTCGNPNTGTHTCAADTSEGGSGEVLDRVAELIPQPATTTPAVSYTDALTVIADRFGTTPDRIEYTLEVLQDRVNDYEDMTDYEPEYRYDLYPGIPDDPALKRALRKLGYTHFLAEPLPVFVYGSLRTGGHNSSLFSVAQTDLRSGIVRGLGVYGPQRGFPYAKPHEDPAIQTFGEVVWLSEDEYGDETRKNLDYLEGFDRDKPSQSHYDRVRVTVETNGPNGPEPVTAWAYIAGPRYRHELTEDERIDDGDWIAARAQHVALTARMRKNNPFGPRRDYEHWWETLGDTSAAE